MSTPTPTVNRRDITVTEEREEREEYGHITTTTTTTTWIATLYGPLSTGEFVTMTRTADTYREALAALESAIADNGWSIK